ncbi:uncharacterized protein KGF55_002595 [Candida pseudojiufengensis]|uniref:uncharacterized protein n=1 Tax=Candida pseudojiufengensis TaxID=497109 RepID=UPI002224AACD|nr:uncharacterized protein KGF55_002595 [Candida pseudojiufengensis]KAI5963715.1 hypothetical protein KGF55_002595 [Candida pseudojiufengensis]
MGSSASKQGSRKLAKTVSDAATNHIKRSDVNPLSNSKHLQQSQQQPQVNQDENQDSHHVIPTSNSSIPLNNTSPDESLNQNETAFRANTSTSFDPRFLHKKIKNQKTNIQQQSQLRSQSQIEPEGKDGRDPHEVGTSTYDQSFLSSINKLGKQIKTVEFNPTSNDKNALVLKQLRSRKKLYELGEEENRKQMEQTPESQQLQKTMVNPQTLTSILKDLKDPRVDNKTILKDYQLEPDFLIGLEYFQVPTNIVEFEEESKEDEVGHKSKSNTFKSRKIDDETPDENENEGIDSSTYKKLQKRISLDD